MNYYLPQKPVGHFVQLKTLIQASKIEKWNILQTVFMFIGILFNYAGFYVYEKRFLSKYLRTKNSKKNFDIQGIKIAFTENRIDFKSLMFNVFNDDFLIYCYYSDNYDRKIVESLEPFMDDGPYCYKDGNFDVTIKKMMLS